MATKFKPKKCPFCGKQFQPSNGKHVFCTPLCRERKRNGRANLLTDNTRNKELVEMAIEARAHGMTYGQWVAQVEVLKRDKRR